MSWQLPLAQLTAVLLGGVRAAAWLSTCPPFNSPVVPAPIKALLAVALALPVVGTTTVDAAAIGTDPNRLLIAIVVQVLVGAALGFITALFFAAVQAAGELIDLLGGFSMAFAFDPLGMNQTSVFGRFYHLTAVTLLFVTDGYQLVVRGFLESYRALPLTGTLSLSALDRMLTLGVTHMFTAALEIAAPLGAVLFCTDLALGLLNRVAPALNAFSMGFPAKIFLVLSLGGLDLGLLPTAVHNLVVPAVEAVITVSGGGR